MAPMRVTSTFGLALLCASLLGQCQADNEYPIVLLHGVAGWGREELLGVKYWGGLYGDLQEDMKARSKTEVFSVAMGPLSSNWDRTCEAYAQIKGAVVDYGIEHAREFSITRFGRDYSGKGLYPQWGDIDSQTGMVNKVHLLGHSMGGMDARVLTHFLNNGAPLKSAEGDSVLFSGGHDWIASVTTLATPHDGSPAALLLSSFTSLITGIVGFAAGGLGGQLGSSEDPLYDFKLDQFDLTRNDGESFDSYFGRVKSSALFDENYKNTALWSLNPDGALELNKWVECVSNVHYFSIAASATYSNFFTGRKHVPKPTQLIVLWPFSFYIGSLERSASSTKMGITRDWWENDGVVSTKTADGPTRGTCETVAYDGRSLDNQKGKFLYLGKKSGWDHLDITGLGERNIKGFYRDIQDWTLGLKASPPLDCTTENGCDGSWPVPAKGSFSLSPSVEEIAALKTSVLEPGPDLDGCKKLAEVCPADSKNEFCDEMNEAYQDCFVSGATSVAPVLGLVFAFVSLLW